MAKLQLISTPKNHSRHLMGYMILSVTGFRREVGVFHHFIAIIFCLFLKTVFVKKAFDEAMSRMKLLLFNNYNHVSVLCLK